MLSADGVVTNLLNALHDLTVEVNKFQVSWEGHDAKI